MWSQTTSFFVFHLPAALHRARYKNISREHLKLVRSRDRGRTDGRRKIQYTLQRGLHARTDATAHRSMSFSTVVSFTGNDASTLSIELGNSTAGSVIVELRDPSAAHHVMKRIILEAGETAKVLNFSSRGLFWVPSISFLPLVE